MFGGGVGVKIPVEHISNHLQFLLGGGNFLRARWLRLAEPEERHYRLLFSYIFLLESMGKMESRAFGGELFLFEVGRLTLMPRGMWLT